MKKVLALLMALLMSVSILSSCKSSEEKEAEKEIIEETVAAYAERMVSGDGVALQFVSEESDYVDEADKAVKAYNAVYEIFEDGSSVPEDCMEKVKEIRTDAVEKFMKLFDYETKKINVKGNTATAKIVLTTPDIEKKDTFRRVADEKSKKAFTKEEVDTIIKAQGTGKIPKELFIKADKEWCEEFVEAFEESVYKKKITYKLEKIGETWVIVGE